MATATSTPAYVNKFALDMVQSKTPSSRQQLTMELIATAHADDGESFVVGVPFPNFSDGDGYGPSSGQVLIFKPDAIVKSTDFGPEVLGITVMADISDMVGGLSDERIQSKLSELVALAPTYAPEKMALSLDCRDPITHLDKREWTAELGPTGSASISKTTDGRKNSYALLVHASPDLLNKQLKQWVRNNNTMTYKQLLADPLFSYARNAVERNAQRIAANIRSGFRLTTNGSRVLSDIGSTVAPHEIAPNVLHPEVKHFTSTVRRLMRDGQERVAVFNSVIPAENCGRRVVIDQGPWAGYVVYDTEHTSPALGYPASTAVKTHHSTVKVAEQDRQVVNERSPYFTWAGKPVGASVQINEFPSVLLSGLHELIEHNDHFVGAMRQLGLRKIAPVAKLLPVAMKVASPTETRTKT